MSPRAFLLLVASSLAFSVVASPSQARADVALGGHFGVNLDAGHPMLGADIRADLVDISSRVRLDIWGAYTHVFIEDWRDVNILEVDFPFLFRVNTDVVTPYAAPGLGISFSGDDTTLKLNMIGGVLFHVGSRFEPFAQIAIRVINGTYVDLIGGLLVRLGDAD
jgi:hypothetical protein